MAVKNQDEQNDHMTFPTLKMATYTAVSIDLPKTQDCLVKPEIWNTQWEELYARRVFPPEFIYQHELREVSRQPAGRDPHYEYSELLKNTCGVRYDLGYRFVVFDDENFEKRWTGASVEVRRKHALIALSEACAIARYLNDARASCAGELTLANLSENGQVVVNMIKAMMPDDLSQVPDTPYFFPNKAWDAFEAKQKKSQPNEVQRISLARILALRTKLIYHVLFYIFMSFLGKELPKVHVRKHRTPKDVPKHAEPDQLQKKLQEAMLGRDGAKQQRKEDKIAWKDRMQQRRIGCSLPGCNNYEPEGQKFMRCGKCWKEVQRDVTYCSKECQVKDWKLRHKRICGKNMDLDTAVQNAAAAPVLTKTIQIGPPINGFK
ncbi:hypothetical protein C8J56DRAFT_286907 [Mycena floridula]|nr:hypothetical protein C8J56DRAFT_286907 [Mycena floridula]